MSAPLKAYLHRGYWAFRLGPTWWDTWPRCELSESAMQLCEN
ncbi:hypothetical protein GGR36_002100 [Niveibacterium umoris]|uniref:Uncharacterized protein n=1 Tax=Niveibacterium umoris TaxID=1193620 RepID=A0A840BMB5_9RHOO|nr:hypothetical protein [Niveibacterium umoris]